MEPDSEGILDESEDFAIFRNKVVELIKDVVFVVGSANVFSHMFDILKSSASTSAQWDMFGLADTALSF